MGQMAGLAGSYTAARAAAEPDKNALYRPPGGGLNVSSGGQGSMNVGRPQEGTYDQGGGIANVNGPYAYGNAAPAQAAPKGRSGLGGSYAQVQATVPDAGGVVAGQNMYANPAQQPQQGPSLAEIQAEMQRRQVGAQLNANPQNSALAGYMMGQ